jgi:predicted nucleic acid-binding protein
MSFVDSSAWYAAYVPSDPQHHVVSRFLRSEAKPFVTSDYVVDETITLLLRRGERRRAVQFGNDVFVAGIVRLELLSLPDLVQAYNVFTRYSDKKWSFTDCTSYVLMHKLHLAEAVSLDHHFHQMQGIAVFPPSS